MRHVHSLQCIRQSNANCAHKKMFNRRDYKVFALLVCLTILVSTVFIFQQRTQTPVESRGSRASEPAQLLLDMKAELSSDALIAAIEQELPALPYAFHQRHKGKQLRYNASCAPLPDLYALHYRQDYWQLHCTANVCFHLYGAYYDTRATLPQGNAVVRLLGMVNQLTENFSAHYCQLWFETRSQPLIVPVSEFRPIWHKWWGYRAGHLYPHLLGCAVPKAAARNEVPQTVSLVATPCARATNNLRVIYATLPAHTPKRGFAVCVKGLDYPYVDMSARLVEWLELLRLLGAQKVIAYELQLHANSSKVLRHYQRSGFVDLQRLTLARGEPSLQHFRHQLLQADKHNKRLNELIPYNDCFYRNMYKYEYIAVLDVDEVIMPLGQLSTWRDIIAVATQIRHDNCKRFASYCFRNIYFPHYPARLPYSTQAPAYLYMLQHVLRVQRHQRKDCATKCLHSTAHVLTLHNHYPLQWTQSCKPETINTTLAQLQHYRQPNYNKSSVATPVLDDNIWRFKVPLVQRTRAVLQQLGFLGKIEN